MVKATSNTAIQMARVSAPPGQPNPRAGQPRSGGWGLEMLHDALATPGQTTASYPWPGEGGRLVGWKHTVAWGHVPAQMTPGPLRRKGALQSAACLHVDMEASRRGGDAGGARAQGPEGSRLGAFPTQARGSCRYIVPRWRQTAPPRPPRGHLNPIAIILALLLPLPCGLGGWGELWGEGKDAGDWEGEGGGGEFLAGWLGIQCDPSPGGGLCLPTGIKHASKLFPV